MANTASKGARKKGAPQKLNASEALFGFVGYLTSRDVPLTLSRAHQAPPMPEIIGAFIKANKLPSTREGWQEILQRPEGVDHLTNEPQNGVCELITPELALQRINDLLDHLPLNQRNMVLGRVIKRERDGLRSGIESNARHLQDLEEAERQLVDILEGKIVLL